MPTSEPENLFEAFAVDERAPRAYPSKSALTRLQCKSSRSSLRCST